MCASVYNCGLVYKFCGTLISKRLIPSSYACRELLAVPRQQLPHVYGGACALIKECFALTSAVKAGSVIVSETVLAMPC